MYVRYDVSSRERGKQQKYGTFTCHFLCQDFAQPLVHFSERGRGRKEGGGAQKSVFRCGRPVGTPVRIPYVLRLFVGQSAVRSVPGVCKETDRGKEREGGREVTATMDKEGDSPKTAQLIAGSFSQ